jgi:Kinesin motor domain
MRGIIPRTVEQILSRVKVLKEGRWNYTISASFLEIYNEQVRVFYDTTNDAQVLLVQVLLSLRLLA